MNQDKLNFIYDELTNIAKEIHERMQKAMLEKKIGITEELLKSLSYQVFKASGSSDGRYELSFLEYGRMLDMNVGRARKIESIKTNRRIIVGARDKKFYSKPAYGKISRLISNLVNGYQEQSIATIKDNLQ